MKIRPGKLLNAINLIPQNKAKRKLVTHDFQVLSLIQYYTQFSTKYSEPQVSLTCLESILTFNHQRFEINKQLK